jgi:cell pole-organizing protein PopZ
MSDAKPQPDPSMEQILASINRIITEDKATAAAAAPGPDRGVLDLTEAIAEDGSVRLLTPAAMASTGESKPSAGIASAATAGAAAAAFAELAAASRERHREGELPLGGGDRTLEAIVREALRPMLQAWLDENLPGVVERLVREEIARAAREAGLR